MTARHGTKKTPPLPCVTVPLNLFRNRWDPRNCFRRPVKACRPQLRSSPVSYLLRSKDIVSYHEHRQGKFKIRFQRTPHGFPELPRAYLRTLSAAPGGSSRKKIMAAKIFCLHRKRWGVCAFQRSFRNLLAHLRLDQSRWHRTALPNPKGIASFSPALDGAAGLRWVGHHCPTTLKELDPSEVRRI